MSPQGIVLICWVHSVPRAAALKGSGIDHFWHVTDHVVLDDPRLVAVRGWLERQ